MKQIILEEVVEQKVNIKNISTCRPVFAKKGEKLIGMIVCEGRGWILRTGGSWGEYGHLSSLEECITEGINTYGYTFHVE